MNKRSMMKSFLLVLGLTICLVVPATAITVPDSIQWIDHLGFLPGDPSVFTSFNAVNSGVGGGLSGLIVTSSTTGETAEGGGNKVVEQGIQVPPGFLVRGARICYEVSSANSFISQIRIAQLQNPPATALVRLDDGTDLTAPGPVCVNSASPWDGPIDPGQGALRLSLRVNFGDTDDRIVIRGVGLLLVPDPNSALVKAIEKIEWLHREIDILEAAFKEHNHTYLTGHGVGHNNVVAITGDPLYVVPDQPVPPKKPIKGKGKGKKK